MQQIATETLTEARGELPLADNMMPELIVGDDGGVVTTDDAWDTPGWREAAIAYHKDRGDRVGIAPYTPEAIARLRRLMDDSVSLDRAWHELNIRNRPAASATLEALVFSLRRGVQELLQPDTRRRLSELAEDQVEGVCHRIQNFKPAIAPAWPPDDVGLLISAWGRRHE
jgi:hypothetical protein